MDLYICLLYSNKCLPFTDKLSKPYHAKAKSESLDSRMTLIFWMDLLQFTFVQLSCIIFKSTDPYFSVFL